jgi:hypothetical protein
LAKSKEKNKLEETADYWFRQGYIERRTYWMYRLRPFLREKSEQCKACRQGHRCNRIPLNEEITAKIARGEECPDFKAIWKGILDDKEEYDWGF